jgi:hypothetical protein
MTLLEIRLDVEVVIINEEDILPSFII